MQHNLTVLGESGLRFFGEMSAANAHEIKNALAIINENAGLLGDLAAMADNGAPLDPERLKRISKVVHQQVRRADSIAKSTNRFAHSVDQMHGPADLERSLVLIQTMAMRFATQRHIRIEIVPCSSSITLMVQPFRLLHVLWLCLQCAMETVRTEQTIHVRMEKGDITTVRFGPLPKLNASRTEALSRTAEMKALLDLMNGNIEIDLERNDLVLTLIKSSDPG
jgi:C4-dicarboxylate-specific signal transduction histidine kinase